MTATSSAAEVNLLVYHYLKEAGFHHACFALRHESRLDDEPISYEAIVVPGRLLQLLRSGLTYLQVEAHINPDGSEKPCSAPFRLVGPPHTCDRQPQETRSFQARRQSLTPEAPAKSQRRYIEASSQTSQVMSMQSALSMPEGVEHSSGQTRSTKHSSDDLSVGSSTLTKRKASPTPHPTTESQHAGKKPRKEHGSFADAASPTLDAEHRTERSDAVAATGHKGRGSSKTKARGKGKKTASSGEKIRAGSHPLLSSADEARMKSQTTLVTGGSEQSVDATTSRRGKESPRSQTEFAEENVKTLKGHRGDVYSSAWNPTVPDLIASAGGDATVRIWTLSGVAGHLEPPAVCKHLPTTQAKDVASLDWNPDGTLLASGSHDGILRLWTPQGDLHLVMSMHQGPIFAVRWNRNGTMLLTASGDGSAIVWDLGSGKVRQQFPLHSDSVMDIDWLVSKRVTDPSSIQHESIFATASADNSINLCRIGDPKSIKTLVGHDDEVNAVRFHTSQKLLASASDDRTARIWAIDASALLGRDGETAGKARKSSSGLSKGRRTPLSFEATQASGSTIKGEANESSSPSPEDETAKAIGTTGDPLGNSEHLKRESDLRRTVDADTSGSSQAHDLDSSTTRLLQAPSDLNSTSSQTSPAAQHGCTAILRGHLREIYTLEWAPTGPGTANPGQIPMLATCSYDKTARIWDVASGKCLQVVAAHSDAVYAICWSPDASILVTGSTDNSVILSRVSDGAVLKTFHAGDAVFDVAWQAHSQLPLESDSSDQRGVERHRLAVCSADRTLTILELGTLQELHAAVPGHSSDSKSIEETNPT